MTMRRTDRVDVILAAVEPGAELAPSLIGFRRELGDQGELIVVTACAADVSERIRTIDPAARVVSCAPETLVPELWAEGLKCSEARFVATTTARMVPRTGLLQAMIDRLIETGAAGVGGPIEPSPTLARFDQAVYLHRYLNYKTPCEATDSFDPPGDNAMYRRDRLDRIRGSWSEGFWEVEVHRALRKLGERLTFEPSAGVIFTGGESRPPLLRARVRHASRYAYERTKDRRLGIRIGRLGATPLVGPLLLGRVWKTMMKKGMRTAPWAGSAGDLILLKAAWTWGEIGGLVRALGGSRGGSNEDGIRSDPRDSELFSGEVDRREGTAGIYEKENAYSS
jgi:hypothetical protein